MLSFLSLFINIRIFSFNRDFSVYLTSNHKRLKILISDTFSSIIWLFYFLNRLWNLSAVVQLIWKGNEDLISFSTFKQYVSVVGEVTVVAGTDRFRSEGHSQLLIPFFSLQVQRVRYQSFITPFISLILYLTIVVLSYLASSQY